MEDELRACRGARGGRATTCCCEAKQYGFSDRQLAHLWDTHRDARSARDRKRRGIEAVVQARSTPAPPSSRPYTPYYYSTYEDEDETPAEAAAASRGS